MSARESILPLFEDEHQARRTRPDVTKSELFVHLHGMLFTKIALDDFDDVLARFMEKLHAERILLQRTLPDEATGILTDEAAFGEAEWFMLAVINISALLQYGAEDAVLRRFFVKDATSSSKASKSKTPQAIMLNPSSLRRSETLEDAGGPTTEVPDPQADQIVMQLSASADDGPLVFRLAQRLTFDMLRLAFSQPVHRMDNVDIVNPYITLVLTFLGHMAQHHQALRQLERFVPWRQVVHFFNTLPPAVEVRLDGPSKLVGNPLPEDWCIRGMEWTGRHLFSRGFWRSKPPHGAVQPHDELSAPPPAPSLDGTPSCIVESEMDALGFSLDSLEDSSVGLTGQTAMVSPAGALAAARWQRFATVAAWLARNVAGFDFDVRAGPDSPRFSITGGLETKLRRWRREEEEAAEAERLSKLSLQAAKVPGDEEEASDEDDTDEDEALDDPADSPALRDLKVRVIEGFDGRTWLLKIWS